MSPCEPSSALLAPELRRFLLEYLRRRLPPSEVEDALQAVYCAALEARNAPLEREHLRRWMTVIARRQVAAYFQRASSEQLGELPEIAVQSELSETLSLVRWAERQAGDCRLEAVDQTLDWMARESEGERLEAIAADARVPSARVRQRVFRLRRFMKERWALEISAALVVLIVFSWAWSRRSAPVSTLQPLPRPPVSVALPIASVHAPPSRAAELRDAALLHCEADRFEECLRLLDEAAVLDPAGDSDAKVVAARKRAAEKLSPPSPPLPTSVPPLPTSRKAPVTPRTRSTASTPSSVDLGSSGSN